MYESLPLVPGPPGVWCAADIVSSLKHTTVDWSKGTYCQLNELMQLMKLGVSEVRSVAQGQAPVGSFVRGPQEAETFCTFGHNILHFCSMQDFFAGQRGHGLTPVPPRTIQSFDGH